MSGFFGCISKHECISDVFYGTDYHSHLGTKRTGMAFYSSEGGFQLAIHSVGMVPVFNQKTLPEYLRG